MSTAILLINLGTPEAPTAPALKRYLAEFLSDPRIVDLPRWQWWPILHGIILRTRPKKSAEKYAKIWMPEGSPLAVHTAHQAELLGQALPDIPVVWAMRYGTPSVASVLDRLRGITRVLILPLYPQYSASTTESSFDALTPSRSPCTMEQVRVHDFHDHPGYIAALAASVRDHWATQGRRAQKLLMSFHGLPAVAQNEGYARQCHRTASLLALELNLAPETWQVTFQSRFGRAQWLQPYTQATLEQLAREGVTAVEVICPGFVTDCLETLEEIAMECRDAFRAAGGLAFGYIPCLNERNDWIDALTDLCRTHLREENDIANGG